MSTMNVVDKGKGPIFDPGLCRCCGSMKRCRVLNVEYECMGQKEMYADMLIDCFGIMLSHLDGKPSSRLVCATCVSRLREAAAFRAQVLRCEAAFMQVRMCDGEADDHQARLDASAKLEVQVKLEPEECASGAEDPPEAPADSPGAEQPAEAVAERAARRPRALPQTGEDEPRMTPEEATELKKHKANIRVILECSNATPIRCYSGVGYKCGYCKDAYRNPGDLKAHTLAEHDVKTRKVFMQRNLLCAFLVRLDITGLKCQICDGGTIDSVEDLVAHLRSVHEKRIHTDIKSHVLPFRFDDGLKCVACARVFTKFRSLQEHMSVHYRNYICDVCEAGYPTKRMLGQHLNVHRTGVFRCGFCPKTFDTDQKKKVHERHVHAESKFLNKCGVCHERFKSYRAKEKHMSEAHGLSSAVRCQACEKTFRNQRQLSVHVQRDHLMRRPHSCPHCDMSFYCRQQLINHSVRHTGVRQFRCEVCLKAYGRRKTLREHMRIHAADRRFRCHHCGLGFVQKCSWRGHMRAKHSELVAE